MSYAPLPTASQVTSTLARIAEQEDDIAATEKQIKEYEDQIATLQSKISSIRDGIAANRAYIAPIRRLPFEVLGEIIVYCATDIHAPVQVLRTLSSICRSWRDATLRTPRAWSKIIIDSTLYTPSYASRRSNLTAIQDVAEWLTRSGSCKKDITWRSHGSTSNTAPVCDLLCSYSTQIRSLQLGTNGLSELLSHDLPSLETLDIMSYDHTPSALNFSLSSATHLTRLRLPCAPSLDLLQPIKHHLRYLYLDFCTAFDLLDLFRSGGGLLALEAVCLPYLNCVTIDSGAPTIVANQLRTFFANIDAPVGTSFFSAFRMPSLETAGLGFSGSSPKKKDAATTLRMLLDHSGATLRDLRLDNVWVSDADLLHMLARVPGLKRLAILNAKTSDKVIAGLSSPPVRKPWICPQLTSLCVRNLAQSNSDRFRVSLHALKELAAARYAAFSEGDDSLGLLDSLWLDQQYSRVERNSDGAVVTEWKLDSDHFNGRSVISQSYGHYHDPKAPAPPDHWWCTGFGAYFF